MPSPGELARGAVRPALAPLQHKSSGLLSAPAFDGKGLAKGSTACTKRTSRFAAASAAGSGGRPCHLRTNTSVAVAPTLMS